MVTKTAPYGTWESPIKPSTFAAGSVALEQIQVNEANGKIYLLEVRPHEEGRGAIVEYANSIPRDVLPERYSALSQVHEYGGASFIVRNDGRIIFTDFDTKGVFVLDPETQEVNLLGTADPKVYYADFTVNAKYIVAIREDHHPAKIEEIKNSLVIISGSRQVKTLVEGSDFYSFPRFSPDGKKLCWISWNHPAMPWTNTELWVADVKGDELENATCIAGRTIESSITQPVWGNDSALFFVDDRTGHWQLYQWNGSDARHIQLNGLEEADFAGVDWCLGCQWYTPMMDDETLVAFCNSNGAHEALVINTKTNEYKSAGFPVNQVFFNSVKRVSATEVAVIGATAEAPASLMLLDLTKANSPRILKSSINVDFPSSYFSKAKSIKFPRIYGSGGGHAYGVFVGPKNPEYSAPAGTLPPLIAAVHGGPTWGEGLGVYMRDQFWTTRGYAVVQVNYIGSSGFGRDFVNLLNGQWGVGDIADLASCVDYLAKEGLIDGQRVAVTGHSSGGYATMQAMCIYPEIWSCGVSESGMSDLQVMAEETHKFEVRPYSSRHTLELTMYTVSIPTNTPVHRRRLGRRPKTNHQRTKPNLQRRKDEGTAFDCLWRR